MAGQKREARLHADAPATYVWNRAYNEDVDARDKRGDDESNNCA
ncbi:hypothetical protein [Bradyrhizobium sp.]|nr:hypothetical protein [Bradyrhizobium sp.]